APASGTPPAPSPTARTAPAPRPSTGTATNESSGHDRATGMPRTRQHPHPRPVEPARNLLRVLHQRLRLRGARVTTFAQPDAGWIKPPWEGPAGVLATDVIQAVKYAAANAPRSLQAAPGPSELGTPCTRRLAYKTADWDPKPNSDTDPWASVQGTAVHAWMAA